MADRIPPELVAKVLSEVVRDKSVDPRPTLQAASLIHRSWTVETQRLLFMKQVFIEKGSIEDLANVLRRDPGVFIKTKRVIITLFTEPPGQLPDDLVKDFTFVMQALRPDVINLDRKIIVKGPPHQFVASLDQLADGLSFVGQVQLEDVHISTAALGVFRNIERLTVTESAQISSLPGSVVIHFRRLQSVTFSIVPSGGSPWDFTVFASALFQCDGPDSVDLSSVVNFTVILGSINAGLLTALLKGLLFVSRGNTARSFSDLTIYAGCGITSPLGPWEPAVELHNIRIVTFLNENNELNIQQRDTAFKIVVTLESLIMEMETPFLVSSIQMRYVLVRPSQIQTEPEDLLNLKNSIRALNDLSTPIVDLIQRLPLAIPSRVSSSDLTSFFVSLKFKTFTEYSSGLVDDATGNYYPFQQHGSSGVRSGSAFGSPVSVSSDSELSGNQHSGMTSVSGFSLSRLNMPYVDEVRSLFSYFKDLIPTYNGLQCVELPTADSDPGELGELHMKLGISRA
ncbi:hypothetical protein D9613_003610 [Agrocybe pediades]|uniref:Uncharacterized protein n=1 Tax=Agrocybe pediades TaxID=84607 RepID=A0A8H4QJG5_9AGAR|nr:hypothetical protein D9613_003610 [Agrocybe pediades]